MVVEPGTTLPEKMLMKIFWLSLPLVGLLIVTGSGATESPIDPGVEVAIAPEGEVALEDHALMAAQHRYNGIGELLRIVEVQWNREITCSSG